MIPIIRQFQGNAKITEQNILEALETGLPREAIEGIVKKYGLRRQRQRKLSAELGICLIIGMNLFAMLSLTQVMYKLLRGFRFIWPGAEIIPASKGAICQQRYAIGAKPIVDLFHQVCHPMASPNTPGAFLFELRLMALDGTDENVADTPPNVKTFGRHTSGRGEAGYPQLKAVYLEEVGSHAIVDAGLWPIHTSERKGGFRMLRSVKKGMLIMWDTGFHSFEMVKCTRSRQAHVLGRLPAGVKPQMCRQLPDGTRLVHLNRSDHNGRILESILVRLIEYTVTDPALPGYGERRRLITSLLNWRLYPALELARAYHERWEIEITIDELDTHLRLAFHPLRSQRPVGVIQELYGMLIAHYLVRKVMLDSANLAGLDPDRISFTNALRLIGDALPEFQQTIPDQHPDLYRRLLLDIARLHLPPRQPRVNPRVVKKKMSNFERKRPEHYHGLQPRSSFADAIVPI